MSSHESAPRRGGMVRNFLHLGLGQVATTILSILFSATLARTLSTQDFGQLYLITSIATFAYVVIDWGHGAIIVREAARYPERSGHLMGSALAVRIVMALISCPVVFAITWLLGYDLATRLLAASLVLAWLPQYLGLSLGWVFRAHERMDRDALLNVAFRLSMLVGAIACMALGWRLEGLVGVWLAAGSLTLGIGYAMYRRLQLPRLSASTTTARELLKDGASLFLMSLAITVEPFINTNILYKMASPSVVGWYGAAWTIAGTLIAPATVLGMAMYPRLSAAAGDVAAFRRAFDVSFRPLWLLAVLAAVGTYLFAEIPVAIIYGADKFAPAADTLRAFAPVLLLMYADLFLTTAVLAAGKAGRLSIAKVASVVLTTGLVFVFVPLCQERFANGGIGVMYAMLGGELIMVAAACSLIRESVNARVIGDMLRCLLAGILTVLLFRLVPELNPLLAVPMCVLAFGGLAFLVGALRRSEVDVLLALFRKRSPDLAR